MPSGHENKHFPALLECSPADPASASLEDTAPRARSRGRVRYTVPGTEDLVLELSDLDFQVDDNSVRRARARARLVLQPADPARPAVHSMPWRLIAPIGPIKADDLAWYLERYPIWPGTPYQARARQVEQDSTRRSAFCWSARGPRTMPAATSTIAPRRCHWWRPWSTSAAWSR